MPTQRDIMCQMWKKYAPDIDRVVREYALAERAGRVARKSNLYDETPIQYAKRLLADGLAKGWLNERPTSRDAAGPERHVSRSCKSVNIEEALPIASYPSHDREEWAATMAHRFGVSAESPEYLRRVSAWRNAWRPERVRILLVAESHVVEQSGDIEIQVRLPASVTTPSPIPKGFCRLVYCLGYGESDICQPKPSINGGTWQFWDIFGAIANRYEPSVSAKMPRRKHSNLNDRLLWKIDVLDVLRRAGVWLEDASIIALYSPGGKRRAKGVVYTQIVRTSFEAFVWPMVKDDNPEQVWVIGRGVGGALRGLPMIRDSQIISQPQDRDKERREHDMAYLLNSLVGRK